MLAFVRIFTAPLNVLEEYLQERKTLDKLKDTQLEVGDCDALEFLEKRCMYIFIMPECYALITVDVPYC